MEDCVFCKMVRKEILPEIVWEDDNYMAFLDQNPVKPGHTLLIPKKHTDYLFDIEDKEYADLFMHAKTFSKILKKAFNPKRVGLVVEGFGVPHAHIHLVPINNIGELTPIERIPPTKDELKKIADIIRETK